MSDQESRVSDEEEVCHVRGVFEMERQRLAGSSAVVAIPEDVREAQAAGEEITEFFTAALWKGNVMYQCKLCAYNTFYAGDIQAHLHQQHTCAPAETKRRLSVPLFDARGDLIDEV